MKYSEFLAAMMSSRIEIHEDLVRTAFKRFDTDPGDGPGIIQGIHWKMKSMVITCYNQGKHRIYKILTEWVIW